MAAFDNFGQKVGRGFSRAAKKIRQMATIFSCKLGISKQKSKIKDVYQEIGEKYYCNLRNNDIKELKPFCEKIDLSAAKIFELETKINRLKGLRVCSVCGTATVQKAKYCPNCGLAVPDLEPE